MWRVIALRGDGGPFPPFYGVLVSRILCTDAELISPVSRLCISEFDCMKSLQIPGDLIVIEWLLPSIINDHC